MTYDATDHFMRDAIRCCYGAERFFLNHYTLHHRWPLGSRNAVSWVLWPWTQVLDHHLRMTYPSCLILSKQVLHLLIQYSWRDKEEGENWRQSIRHPSVPLYYLYNYSRISRTHVLLTRPFFSRFAPFCCLTDSSSISVSLFIGLPQPSCS
jgi:hypothetical protein